MSLNLKDLNRLVGYITQLIANIPELNEGIQDSLSEKEQEDFYNLSKIASEDILESIYDEFDSYDQIFD